MKFKDNIKILTDKGIFKEIKGKILPYHDKTVNIEIMVHKSENAWTDEAIDVSEKSTGCRLFTLTETKEAKDITPKEVEIGVANFISQHGKKVFLAQIQKQINNNPQIYKELLDNEINK